MPASTCRTSSRLAEPIAGRVRLTHTNRGILARANLRTALAMECVRCLRPTTVPLELAIEDEVLPSLDIATGQARGRPTMSPISSG